MSKNVLFVDDSSSMRWIVENALEAADYTVVTAVDGKDALPKLHERRYDVVISDLNMPNMNGIEFIKQVKIDPNNKFTPIIMMTTDSSATAMAEGKQAGAKVWIVKPFKPEEVIALLDKIIQ
ncbi:MAG: response regulator [Pseudomonadales bacterium]